VATIAAPFDVEHVSSHFGEAVDDIRESGASQVTLGGRPFTIRRSFLDDLASHDPATRIAALHRPLLILHAPLDPVVGIEQATSIYMAARHPKSFVSLDTADHLLTNPADAQYAAGIVAAWASRYLPKQPAPEPDSSERRVVAELTGKGRFQTRVTARGGAFIADEPAEVGGLDSGPTPYELLGAALGACTAMTMRLYADRKGWDLPALRVRVAHARLPQNPPLDRFTREILFDIPVEPERRARLLEIADRCPVHRTLERASDVVTLASNAAVADIASEPASQHVRDMDEAEIA
jgi:putative redox protein